MSPSSSVEVGSAAEELTDGEGATLTGAADDAAGVEAAEAGAAAEGAAAEAAAGSEAPIAGADT